MRKTPKHSEDAERPVTAPENQTESADSCLVRFETVYYGEEREFQWDVNEFSDVSVFSHYQQTCAKVFRE